MRRALVVPLISTALLASVLAAPAAAVVNCTFTSPTVTITLDAETATIARSGEEITVNGMPCVPPATVTSADMIAVTGTAASTVEIDLSAGQFSPGLTPEPDGVDSEIEFQITLPAGGTLRVVGGPTVDEIVVGSSGINLNAAETVPDVDVTITGGPSIVVEGGGDNDTLSVTGGTAEGSSVTGVTIRGGIGDDTLAAALGPNTLEGGDGVDTLDYSAVAQLGLVDLGGGGTVHVDGSIDSLAGIENVTGSPGDDRMLGDGAGNILRGGAGNDTIDGGDGDDVLDGGEGTDTVEFRRASAGVTVDLAAGTATGAGDDQLVGFENVTGSDVADTIVGDGGANLLRGLYGRDEVRGGAGDDHVRGGKGGDVLFGGPGDDLVQAGHGRDQLNGGQGEDICRGAPGPDSFVFCENYPTRE